VAKKSEADADLASIALENAFDRYTIQDFHRLSSEKP
jgi:hypothetical protein